LHVFTYSERDNTEAITLEGKVDYAERKRRNKMLRILSAKKMREFYEKHLNQEYSVLFEHENKNGMMFGFTENYIKVGYTFNEKLVNQSVKICTKAINADGIMDSDIVEAITLQ
jgi:threonylcarbamoyladenosine tRNA methylthiotransferase MtaB